MPHADFVHLRVHSAYSLSEGAIKAEKIATLARDARMPAVAMTDTANLFGGLEFSQACTKHGVQPILGCQIALARTDNPRLPPDPIVLLAQDADGLANLQRLSSASFLETEPGLKPQLPWARIAEHAQGLILLTGGTTGPLARLLAEGQQPEAERLLKQIIEAFPDRTVLELHRHGLPVEQAIEPGLIALADGASIPLAATNDCYFAKPAMYEAHDALLCIAEGRTLAEKDRRRVTPEHWFKPAAEMRAKFADLPEACDNTLAIARRCAVMVETRKPLLPVCPKVREGATEEETVRAMAVEGLERRLDTMQADEPTRARYRERLATNSTSSARWGSPAISSSSPTSSSGRRRTTSRSARPRLRRRIGRRLGADHHRPRPAALQPAVRALPQPGTRVDAGLRHRLLPGRPRPGHRLRAPASTAATGWRRSSPLENSRPAPRCATSAACWGCPTGR